LRGLTKELIILYYFNGNQEKYFPFNQAAHKSFTEKVKHNKELDLSNFFKKSKHFFIMNDAGKPVYARYGNEIENCGFLATFSAIMSKFTHFNSINKETEKLQYKDS
jgi:hypothetical protein